MWGLNLLALSNFGYGLCSKFGPSIWIEEEQIVMCFTALLLMILYKIMLRCALLRYGDGFGPKNINIVLIV